jgi:hypothetical protein
MGRDTVGRPRYGRIDTLRPQVIVCGELKGFGFRVEGANPLAQPCDQNGFVTGAKWARGISLLYGVGLCAIGAAIIVVVAIVAVAVVLRLVSFYPGLTGLPQAARISAT